MGVSCKCISRQSNKSIIEEIFAGRRGGDGWRVGVVNLVILARVSRTTTKKVKKKQVINFLRKNCAPQRKYWLRL